MLPFSFITKKLFPLSLIASLFLTGCSVFTDAPQTTFDPKGPVAQVQLNLFNLTLVVCTFIFVAVAATLLFVVVRYRRRAGEKDKEISPNAHGNPVVEISLIVASVLILVIIAVPTYNAAVYGYDIPEELEPEAIDVYAIGYQWWWRFEYPDLGVVTANELIIPAGRPVRVHLRSRDVIHSFWVPKLAGKRDMVPNRDNFLWLMADEPGEFHGQCAEYCGTSHANMLFRVFAKSAADFDQWVENQKEPGHIPEAELALTGRDLFNSKGCVQCHHIDGLGGGVLGPDLTHVGSRTTIAGALLENTEKNLNRWISNPEAIKPGNLMTEAVMAQNLTEAEIEALVAFLTSLK